MHARVPTQLHVAPSTGFTLGVVPTTHSCVVAWYVHVRQLDDAAQIEQHASHVVAVLLLCVLGSPTVQPVLCITCAAEQVGDGGGGGEKIR